MNDVAAKQPWERYPIAVTDVTRADAPRRLATLTMGSRSGGLRGCELPASTPLELPGDFQIAHSAFKAWLAAAASPNDDPAAWADAAVVGAAYTAGPVNVAELSNPPVFSNVDFDTPLAWATAEWDAQWDRFARMWANYWEGLVDHDGASWSACRRVIRSDVSSNRHVLDAVCHLAGLYHGRIDGDIVTFAGPTPVTAWVACVVTQMNPPAGLGAWWSCDSSDDELHGVAVGLWSNDVGDALFHYEDALTAAAAVLQPT